VRDARDDFAKRNTAVIGVSPDTPESQGKFDSKNGLGFPLLSDTGHAMAEAYGVWGEKSLYGKKYFGIIRSSFLIDERGRIAGAWYKVSPGDTVPEARAVLERK
jgi:thioredoxin-dependent peroxiredoxin